MIDLLRDAALTVSLDTPPRGERPASAGWWVAPGGTYQPLTLAVRRGCNPNFPLDTRPCRSSSGRCDQPRARGDPMSRHTFVGVCGGIVCVGLLAVTAARPQQRPAEPAPDPVRQRLHELEESLRFAEE